MMAVAKIIQHQRDAFLEHFRQHGNISAACKHIGISRRTHYLWMKEYEDYAQKFNEACEAAVDAMEQEAVRRAVDGVPRYKFFQGAPIMHPTEKDAEGNAVPYVEHEYSDDLLKFCLMGGRPEKYRPKDTPIQIDARQIRLVLVNGEGQASQADSGGGSIPQAKAIEHIDGNGHSNGNGRSKV